MSLAKTLWEENVDLTWAALEHRFVRGLGDGDLPLGSFQEYVAQDAFFLEAFARAYAFALAQSPDRQGLHDFVEPLAGVLEELELHGKYAERWSVELADVVPGEATLAYTDFLLATAALRGVGETCAAMTPCMRLYAFLGQSLADEGVDENNAYAEWIEDLLRPRLRGPRVHARRPAGPLRNGYPRRESHLPPGDEPGAGLLRGQRGGNRRMSRSSEKHRGVEDL
jgi:thiaminase/transcriptional activator TenA